MTREIASFIVWGLSTRETAGDKTFKVRWMAINVEGRSPDGSERVIVDEPREFPAGWQVAIVVAPAERDYEPGDQIDLDHRQLLGAVFSHQNYINDVTVSVEGFAKSLGVTFSDAS